MLYSGESFSGDLSFKVPMSDPFMADYGEAQSFQPGKAPRVPFREQKESSIKKIDRLDFVKIKDKLCLEDDGKWSREKADEAEKFYKMFLKLHVLYPNATIVPSKLIDGMWHAHILDTKRYHKDCQAIFGEYMHHYPYFGVEDDRKELEEAFSFTMALFQEHFGENPLSGFSHCGECQTGTGCRCSKG